MKSFKRRTWSWESVAVGILMLFMIGNGMISAKTEKPGAILVLQKKDGQTIKGELLSVNNGMLNLLIYENASKVDVHINELRSLRIEKKGAFFKGLLIGSLTGAATGALVGLINGNDKPGFLSWTAGEKALLFGFCLGVVGGISGGIVGAFKGTDESIQIEGLRPGKLALVEAKLASRARYRSFSAAEPLIAPLPEPLPTPPQVSELPAQVFASSLPPTRRPISRWHISIIPGVFYSQGTSKLRKVIKNVGFGNTSVYSAYWLLGFNPGGMYEYPTKDSSSHFVWKDIRVEYSLTPRLALGLVYTPLGEHSITGWKYMERKISLFGGWEDNGVFLYNRFRERAYFLTAAYMPLPDTFLEKSMLKLGAGIGFASINAAFSEETENFPRNVDKRELNRRVLSLTAFAEVDHFFGRHFSLGFNLDYKYVPFHTDAFRLATTYTYYSTHVTEMVPVDVPEFHMNLGGFGAGVNFGFHF